MHHYTDGYAFVLTHKLVMVGHPSESNALKRETRLPNRAFERMADSVLKIFEKDIDIMD